MIWFDMIWWKWGVFYVFIENFFTGDMPFLCCSQEIDKMFRASSRLVIYMITPQDTPPNVVNKKNFTTVKSLILDAPNPQT